MVTGIDIKAQSLKKGSLFNNITYYIDHPDNNSHSLNIKNKIYWFTGIILTGILVISALSNFISRKDIFWIDTFTHALFESYCGIISFIIAYIIYREYKISGKTSNFFLFLGFFSMGIFDIFHAYSNHCTTLFVWFHTLSAFGGAVFFLLSSVAVRQNKEDPVWLRHTKIIIGIVFLILTAVVITKFPAPLPYAVTIGGSHHTPVNLPVIGEFTRSTIIVNIVSALFFLFAGISFFKYFNKTNDVI